MTIQEKEERLFEALKTLGTAVLTLESAQDIADQMTPKQVQKVVDKFSKVYTEFNEEEMYTESSYYEGYANNIITGIVNKLQSGDND